MINTRNFISKQLKINNKNYKQRNSKLNRHRFWNGVSRILRQRPGQQCLRILTHDDRPHVTGHVVPLDAVVVLVVENGKTRLVVPFLEALDRQTAGVGHVFQFTGLDAFEVVGLGAF